MSYLITVFTPTYNRAHIISKLYNSLLKQTYTNFEWLIVDDGSSDDTESLIQSFISENKIEIIYIKQENGGKHRAINRGVDAARGELFFIVDSDDFLPVDSLQCISNYKRKLNANLAGLAGRKCFFDGKLIGNPFPSYELISDTLERKYILGIRGDLAEVFKTNILKQFKFPDIKDETFCAEGLVWNRISRSYKLLFIDKLLCYCEYLQGGLSDNSIRNRQKNPNYAMVIYKELAETSRLSLKHKLRAYINYWRFSFFNDQSFVQNLQFINYSFYGLCMMPLGFLMRLKDNKSNKVDKQS